MGKSQDRKHAACGALHMIDHAKGDLSLRQNQHAVIRQHLRKHAYPYKSKTGKIVCRNVALFRSFIGEIASDLKVKPTHLDDRADILFKSKPRKYAIRAFSHFGYRYGSITSADLPRPPTQAELAQIDIDNVVNEVSDDTSMKKALKDGPMHYAIHIVTQDINAAMGVVHSRDLSSMVTEEVRTSVSNSGYKYATEENQVAALDLLCTKYELQIRTMDGVLEDLDGVLLLQKLNEMWPTRHNRATSGGRSSHRPMHDFWLQGTASLRNSWRYNVQCNAESWRKQEGLPTFNSTTAQQSAARNLRREKSRSSRTMSTDTADSNSHTKLSTKPDLPPRQARDDSVIVVKDESTNASKREAVYNPSLRQSPRRRDTGLIELGSTQPSLTTIEIAMPDEADESIVKSELAWDHELETNIPQKQQYDVYGRNEDEISSSSEYEEAIEQPSIGNELRSGQSFSDLKQPSSQTSLSFVRCGRITSVDPEYVEPLTPGYIKKLCSWMRQQQRSAISSLLQDNRVSSNLPFKFMEAPAPPTLSLLYERCWGPKSTNATNFQNSSGRLSMLHGITALVSAFLFEVVLPDAGTWMASLETWTSITQRFRRTFRRIINRDGKSRPVLSTLGLFADIGNSISC